jgi:hypothetical protein
MSDFTADRFYTAKEVAEGLGIITEFTLKQLCRSEDPVKRPPHRRLPKRQIAFTREDVQGLKDYFKPEPLAVEADEDESPFRFTERGAARARNKSLVA